MVGQVEVWWDVNGVLEREKVLLPGDPFLSFEKFNQKVVIGWPRNWIACYAPS